MIDSRGAKGDEVSAHQARTGLDLPSLRQAFRDHLHYTVGRQPGTEDTHDQYQAAAFAIRDRLLDRFLANAQRLESDPSARVVAYLSAEFLMGPHLGNNLLNLGIYDVVEEAVRAMGLDLQAVLDVEEEPGLGNGGLGRLAACYMESLASLCVPAIGYGIRYEFGIFDQEIVDGWQREITDKWLRHGNPWELKRTELAVRVGFGGHCESDVDSDGSYRVTWKPSRWVNGVPYDTPVLGYRVDTCNVLRLWEANAVESFDFSTFNVGDYYGAVDAKVGSETLTKVLYPNDEPLQGKRLRLEQQYFFVSCSLQDMLRTHARVGGKLADFPKRFVVQLNDTHPSLGVAELMRLLVDERGVPWNEAWAITCRTFAYTNHTLLPEALETWSVSLLQEVLPRHLQIIYEINQRFLDSVRASHPGDEGLISRVSIIDEHGGHKRVRMAHLAAVGSFAINGVAALHTELLQKNVLRDFYQLWPQRFSNKTNGVTPRRFMALCNRPLAKLIDERIGDGWLQHLERLSGLEKHAEDAAFRRRWREVKSSNKQRLAQKILERTGTVVDPASLFDVQVKRIHEYKRQHLNVLHALTLYLRIKDEPTRDVVPRTVIFGGKAAPGYFMAKLMIKLATAAGDLINDDPDVAGRLKVVFFPDFNVTNAQPIYPAADLSEQISMAGKEASGTGNMKMTLNGALTIGTLDGANVEIREAVGAENFFLFGHTTEQVHDIKARGYWPRTYYESNAQLRRVIDLISGGGLSGGDTGLFRPIVDSLLDHDEYLVLADYQPYIECQREVERAFVDTERWTRQSILNVARSGKFSSDRAIRQYCQEIWNVEALDGDPHR